MRRRMDRRCMGVLAQISAKMAALTKKRETGKISDKKFGDKMAALTRKQMLAMGIGNIVAVVDADDEDSDSDEGEDESDDQMEDDDQMEEDADDDDADEEIEDVPVFIRPS